ncbi:MAG: preprotein translocase subunit SecA [Deltaproteobacteria bacterium]|nr:MAG: preprotein translocase subunit SecA [Deltaproteobacteria bacterium]
MLKWMTKVFGTANERTIKKLKPLVVKVNELEEKTRKYTDAQLQAKTAQFKEKVEQGASLDELLPSAFAVVREAAWRRMGMRHYDVQLIGGIVLHQGKIAEMKTGEGKTLVATAPVYLNALSGKGVHVITVNDYLASRDAEWMNHVYGWLGLDVGTIVHGLNDGERQRAYAADITYGTNNEFGFDYLRDNMKFSLDRRVQRGLNYAIVDEVDSILIDEARTPLIISGPAEKSSDWYYKINAVIPFLKREEDFLVDEKSHTATLTESGVDKVESRLKIDNLYDVENIEILHHVHQALKAHTLYKRDEKYVVEGGKVVIVDEFTGRKMPGRRWSDGLHQAIEAKEGVTIEEENETLATITFQNYFRLYKKLSGMTGTAETEAGEFAEIYKLDTVVIPTNRPIARKDHNDLIYKTEEEKWYAVADEVIDCHRRGQPVLVGTTSVEKSEYLASVLRKNDVPHNVLNAKFHEMEATYVAQAGRLGAVTIATNMAGRGTDIVLGGNAEFMSKLEVGSEEGPEYEEAVARHKAECNAEREQVLAAGGLHIVGTERHESRRVDNQLRGRAGRQGDPGSSRFYISLDDELMRLFGAERIRKVMETLRMPDNEPIEHKWINSAVERAQKKVEDRNFGIRKNVLEYDDVMNDQRKAVYGLRDQVLLGGGTHERVLEAIDNVCYRLTDEHFPEGVHLDEVELDGLAASIKNQFTVNLNLDKSDATGFEDIRKSVTEQVTAFYVKREQDIVDALKRAGEAQGHETTSEVALERWRFFERERFLRAIDTLWKHHLKVMENLKEGIHLESYGQKDPKIEYKKQGFALFEMMMDKIEENVTEVLFRAQGPSEEEIAAIRKRREEEEQKIILGRGDGQASQAPPKEGAGHVVHQGGTYVRALQKIGRNDPCPCGSGQKFKKCHEGRIEELAALMKQRGGRTAAHL